MAGAGGGPPVGLKLRPATVEDLDAVVMIERVSFSDPPWSRRSFASLLDDPRVRFSVACLPDGGVPAVVGYAVTWLVTDEAELANLAVAPDRRRQGIGQYLLDAAMAEAVAGGAASLYLEVRESNVPARALYSGRGFVAVGRAPSYYRNPAEDALLLRYQPGAGVGKGATVGAVP